jgi:phosphate-selective porin OprO and OprP
MKHWLWPGLAIGVWILLAARPAPAQSVDARMRELEKRIAQLEDQVRTLRAANQQKERNLQAVDRQVKVLDRKVEVQQETQRDFTRALPKVDFDYKNQGGLTVKTEDEAYRFTIGGWIQADGRYYTSEPSGVSDTFVMRRVRPYLEGTVDKYYDFRVMSDLGQGTVTLQDAFADIHYFPEVRFRGGKFKEPVGLERWQDDRWNEFVERALPTQLVPDRDIGVEFHGEPWRRMLEYEVGLYNGGPDNVATSDFDNDNGKEFGGRLFLRPFNNYSSEMLRGFGLGFAANYNTSNKGLVLDTYRSAGQNVFFRYTKTADASAVATGNRSRYSPQFYYYSGPFGLLGEFVYNSQKIGLVSRSLGKFPTSQISNYAWNLTGNYVVTGEAAGFDGITPRHNFDPRAGYWGAFELVARADQLVVDPQVFTEGFADPSVSADWALEWSIGFNWWLSRRLKLQTDYSRTTFHQGARDGNRRPEGAFLQELQILF